MKGSDAFLIAGIVLISFDHAGFGWLLVGIGVFDAIITLAFTH